ncbi:MAG TPA: heme o synthase [Candidatus Binataceae bacterium]|nr:heme o synthase [Candidatus Binataceae bacterium]
MTARAALLESNVAAVRGRLSDYLALTKPRVVLMVLVTTLAGFYLGARGAFDLTLAFDLLIGTACAAGGTLALNQYVERDADAVMVRTRHRPLPDGRMRPGEALAFAVVLSAAGFAVLALTTSWLCTVLTATITVIYLCAYTPLKRVSWICDVIGAIPGAIPPMVGFAAARGGLATQAWLMFAIMFLWQLPHTFSVVRLYRADYLRAGFRLLPPDRPDGGNPLNPMVLGATLALAGAGIAPTLLGYAGIVNGIVGAALGAAVLACACATVRAPHRASTARRLLFATLLYLPIMLLVMVLDKA